MTKTPLTWLFSPEELALQHPNLPFFICVFVSSYLASSHQEFRGGKREEWYPRIDWPYRDMSSLSCMLDWISMGEYRMIPTSCTPFILLAFFWAELECFLPFPSRLNIDCMLLLLQQDKSWSARSRTVGMVGKENKNRNTWNTRAVYHFFLYISLTLQISPPHESTSISQLFLFHLVFSAIVIRISLGSSRRFYDRH